jgi:hypothetical protein
MCHSVFFDSAREETGNSVREAASVSRRIGMESMFVFHFHGRDYKGGGLTNTVIPPIFHIFGGKGYMAKQRDQGKSSRFLSLNAARSIALPVIPAARLWGA